jgi:glycosyltransferase involved in cell wall biosynthesis
MTVFTPSVLIPYSVRLPLPCPIKNRILKRNIQSISAQVLEVFRSLYPGRDKPDIVWGTIFHHAGFLGKFPAQHRLAIIDDNFPESPVFNPSQKKEVAALERSLISSSEYIFTTSRTLFEEKSRINPHCVMMENGVSELFLPENRGRLEAFAHQCPQKEKDIIERIKSLPGPRIGYVGALNIRLWMPFLEEIFKAAPQYQLVFIGNIDDSFPRAMVEKMSASANIHIFPYLSHALIPKALEQFDLLLLPFELTRFSRFINPLKLSEYLSSGKPILATPLPEIKRIASEPAGMVYFIEKPEDIQNAIQKALRESAEMQERRISLARSRTWQCTTREMIAIVEKMLKPDLSDQSDPSDTSDKSDPDNKSNYSSKEIP